MERSTPIVGFELELAGLFDMRGKTVFLPGGTGSIGEAIAWALALAGAHVTVAGRGAEKAETLAETFRPGGLEADGIGLDVESVTSICDAVATVLDRHGRIDALVNCFGFQREERMLEISEAAFDEVYIVNLRAAMSLGQAVARHQIAAERGGRQVHLLSVCAQPGLRGRGYSAHCSTKAGMAMLMKQHAMELAPEGIAVDGVAPTFVETEMIRHVMENPSFRSQLLEQIPLGRIADPKDVAGAVLFFCCAAGGLVTGQTLYVEGGVTASQ